MSRPFSNDVLSDAWFAALGCRNRRTCLVGRYGQTRVHPGKAWCRLASDCFELAFLRVGAIRRFLNQPVSDLFEIRKRHEELFEDLAKAMDAFSQTEYGGPSTPPSSTVS